jgi:hypothetical protein
LIYGFAERGTRRPGATCGLGRRSGLARRASAVCSQAVLEKQRYSSEFFGVFEPKTVENVAFFGFDVYLCTIRLRLT